MKETIKRILAIALCSGAVFVAPTLATKMSEPCPLWVRLCLALGFAALCSVLWGLEKRKQKAAPVCVPTKKKPNFDWGMHYFRAFAILMIMACHYVSGHGYSNTNTIFFTTATIFFLFISGYLCQYIDHRKRDAPVAYYRKKLTNVICPFIICSIVFAVLKGAFKWDIWFVKYLLLGRVQGQYWYIPFVSFLFLASPFICRIKNAPLLVLFGLSGVFFLAFPNRPGKFTIQWPEVFYFYTYFTVFYIMGFVYCRYKDIVDVYLKRYWLLWLGCAIALYVVIWNPPVLKLWPAPSGLTICMQRTFVLLCALVFLAKLKDKYIWILDQIAQYSFTLYFIHFAVYIQGAALHNVMMKHLAFLPDIFSLSIIYCTYLAVMLVIAMVLKTAFGKYSRMFIGA